MPALPTGAVLLLHLDEDSTDDSGQGHVQVDGSNLTWDTTNKKFGSASALFTRNANDFITSTDSDDWHFGADDFALDFQALFSALPTASGFNLLLGQFNQTAGQQKSWRFIISNPATTTCVARFQFSTDGTTIAGNIDSTNISSMLTTTGAFHHFRFCRVTNNGYFFIDGSAVGTAPITATLANAALTLQVGTALGQGAFAHTGNLDEVLIVKGTGLNTTTSFTPPEEEWGTVPAVGGGATSNFILLGVG